MSAALCAAMLCVLPGCAGETGDAQHAAQPSDVPLKASQAEPVPEPLAPSAPKVQDEVAPPEPAAHTSERVLASKASPAADKDTRRALLVAHHRTLRCLAYRGAPQAEVAAAFAAAGLTPALWNQALGELLALMSEEPDGDVARALIASDAEVCSGGEAR